MDIDLIFRGQLGFNSFKDGVQGIGLKCLGVGDVESVAIAAHIVIAKVASSAAHRAVHYSR